MTPRPITLTGADKLVPLDELESLAKCGAEVGLLLSASRAGRFPRYPSVTWICKAVERLGPSCAVHICGQTARDSLVSGAYPWLRAAGRLQLNGYLSHFELRRLADVQGPVPVVQWRDGEQLPPREVKAHVLVDASGGRGQLPRRWTRPETPHPVGFAGGLTPENLADQLDAIAEVAVDPWWVDLESGLRDVADQFSVSRAQSAVTTVVAYRGRGKMIDRALGLGTGGW